MNSEVKVKRDVNEFSGSLNTLKQELIKTKERAEQAEKLKSAFLNNISHEIRTPLNGILGFLDFFDDDLPREERDQFIAIMRKSGKRLLATMNNIIEMSELETGNMELNKSVFNLKDALKVFNCEIEHKYANQNISYNCIIEMQKEQLWVEADRVKMFEILENLIDNAYKFTQKGFVKLTAKQTNDTLIFEVEDTGIGVKNEDRQIIFEPFCQADFQLNRRYEGNGLGLAISKQLIQLMGGELKYESPEHGGARFICTFPGTLYNNVKKAATKDKVIITREPLWMKKNNTKEEISDSHPIFNVESTQKRC